VVLVLEDDRGNVGFGEASPLDGRSIDSLASVRRAVEGLGERFEVEPSLCGIDAIVARLPAGAPAARFAVETALADLLGVREAVPVAHLYGARRSSLDLCQLLAPGDPIEAETVKLKASGLRFEEEVASLERLRRARPDVALRIDWNQSIGSPVGERLERLASLEPAFVEEPAPAPLDVDPVPVPIALDESLPAAIDIASTGVVALVLKPAILGAATCRSLARFAAERGLGVVLSHAFDGPIAHAMASAMALSIEGRALPAGLWPHAGLDGAALPHVSGARIVLTDRVGLGLGGLA
jgi:L-alanine-DL-glutamate epimerase-like enolase superfamily enzyme